MLIGILVYRDLDLDGLRAAFVNSARTTIMVMFIIATASLFGWVLAVLQAPTQLAELLAPAMVSPLLTLILIAIMLLCARHLHGHGAADLDHDAHIPPHRHRSRNGSGPIRYHVHASAWYRAADAPGRLGVVRGLCSARVSRSATR